MIILIALIAGAVFGALRARRRKGRTADIVQYAIVHALMFGLIALFVTLILDRTVF
ncbi:MAG: hypothetical protein VX878_13205 [Pseudomonadota bacterium]|jgi:cation transporter-like permease|uniref:PEP-CTERM protein-sorting domain-containing protein n=1 Tax=Pseudooceanicola nitratireducens TaxID=517719 RepID=A0A1I1LRB7_9RHOB|nr:hypothetical protein [Pseudooceanicola nitratireducens]MEC7298142.1 hypothetical protein [Pseudomonadota bacterium]MBY6157115.1 hypothetical protein [Pseudooceanicola nitratireducens]MBY6166072.1 hypothetical protein [Pseudooceanicola nitratireducens]MEC7793816.1 hypothetical protein [Pseudomonadota bacterium]MEC8666970.1 hypothetical protein [Pseudomonadota bacterium]